MFAVLRFPACAILLNICPVCAAVNTLRLAASVINSGPFSPAIKVLGVLFVPFANPGISGMLIPIPPIPGTQSGTFNLLSPRITVFITDTITLNGALKISPNPLNTPLKILLIPSQACDQFPVNTPVIKSINPWNTCITLLTMFAMLCNAVPSTFAKISATNCITGINACKSCCSTGKIACMMFWNIGTTVLSRLMNTGNTASTICMMIGKSVCIN